MPSHWYVATLTDALPSRANGDSSLVVADLLVRPSRSLSSPLPPASLPLDRQAHLLRPRGLAPTHPIRQRRWVRLLTWLNP